MATTALSVTDLEQVESVFAAASDDAALFSAIVNSPFTLLTVPTAMLFLGIVVFLQVNKETGLIDRIALSNTELAQNTTDVSVVPFSEIKIPVDHNENIISQAIQTNTPQDTTDWKFLFEPAMSAEQARLNQASGGIAYSAVYPLSARNGGAMIFSYFQYQSEIGAPQHDFMRAYTDLVNKYLST